VSEKLNILIEHEANIVRREQMLQSIRDYNDSASQYHREIRAEGAKPLDVYAFDNEDNIIGGLVGDTYWGWLAIDYLWVTEEHRHNGLGSLLMMEAETVAVEQRQCQWAKLSTFSFQAPIFYKNLGYQVTGEMKDYPPGQTMLWLKKDLSLT